MHWHFISLYWDLQTNMCIPKHSMHVYAVKNVDFKDGALLLEFYALISEQQTAGLLQEQNAALKIPI